MLLILQISVSQVVNDIHDYFTWQVIELITLEDNARVADLFAPFVSFIIPVNMSWPYLKNCELKTEG